ncbi:hypothetical protein IMCC3317_09180 [Kordia antarctica]|uniref:DUF5640 domain-containing protein n=1 Tax=Kordia antarctica TaxID=1218801 RepID=A0A7L4ZFY2_9FLAO|nr:hypothetical protein [Kordia antarctica]QHI35572.1 hypothetical protein IMCC3317_09180 [Kordia antarctica]
MKILKKLSFALLTLMLLFSFTAPDGEHVGKWKGKDKGDIGFLTLSSDGYATFEFNGQTMGGKSYDHQGTKAAMKYTVNDGTSPTSIDFIILDLEEDTELGRLKGIINMKTSNEMEMAISFGGGAGRPTDFSNDAIVFNRMK